jgi:hypothetical protein
VSGEISGASQHRLAPAVMLVRGDSCKLTGNGSTLISQRLGERAV